MYIRAQVRRQVVQSIHTRTLKRQASPAQVYKMIIDMSLLKRADTAAAEKCMEDETVRRCV